MAIKVTIKQLSAFQAVAKHQSINKASEEMFLSKSAISMAISQLEDILEEYLFYRTTTGLRLSNAGKKLYVKVNTIIDQIKEFENTRSSGIKGELIIGATSLFASYILPALIPTFLKEYPNVSIEIEEASTETTLSKVENFSCDIGFVDGNVTSNILKGIFLRKDYLKTICSSVHPLLDKDTESLDIAKIYDYPRILWEPGFGTRNAIIDLDKVNMNSKVFEGWAFGKQNLENNTVKLRDYYFDPDNAGKITRGSIDVSKMLVLSNPEAIKIAVSKSDALAEMSQTIIESVPLSADVKVLELEGITQYKELNLVYQKRKYKSELLETFVEWIKDKV